VTVVSDKNGKSVMKPNKTHLVKDRFEFSGPSVLFKSSVAN
jgi:hypothetical protein